MYHADIAVEQRHPANVCGSCLDLGAQEDGGWPARLNRAAWRWKIHALGMPRSIVGRQTWPCAGADPKTQATQEHTLQASKHVAHLGVAPCLAAAAGRLHAGVGQPLALGSGAQHRRGAARGGVCGQGFPDDLASPNVIRGQGGALARAGCISTEHTQVLSVNQWGGHAIAGTTPRHVCIMACRLPSVRTAHLG